MRTTTLTLAGGLAATAAAAETIHGVLVLTRHGDRTTKHYGAQQLTALGAQQCFQSGDFYRSRYLSASSPYHISGINGEQYSRAQIYATAPDQDILLNTATAFLQGLYPPLNSDEFTATLTNGTKVSSPLSNYQYVTLHGVSNASPDTIWLKGDESCPAATKAQASYKQSEQYASLLKSTKPFYERMHPYVSSVLPDYALASSLSYEKAYDIFDLINVASIHNVTSAAEAKNIPAEDLFQLRVLADSAEFNTNYNASQADRHIGARALAGTVLTHLSETVTKGNRKFTLLAGSYDTFLSWFGWTELTSVDANFYGLPAYAGTMVFEVFTSDDANEEKRVRWLFRNGTEEGAELKQFPLFGKGKPDLSWTEFEETLKAKGSIGGAQEWCGACGSKEEFCKVYGTGGEGEGVKVQSAGGMDGKEIAGIVLIVVGGLALLAAGAMFVLVNNLRKKNHNKTTQVMIMPGGKGFEDSERGSFRNSDEKGTV
ncbi:lysosomal acid phosphatase [Cladorrhinum sp. PSN259]|nr:lysosomal acid phosphatase [Cladorrhinum sp. PSN259]